MNVICTDKDGKPMKIVADEENNPVLIEKVNIPKKKKDNSTTGKPGNTSKDQTGQ